MTQCVFRRLNFILGSVISLVTVRVRDHIRNDGENGVPDRLFYHQIHRHHQFLVSTSEDTREYTSDIVNEGLKISYKRRQFLIRTKPFCENRNMMWDHFYLLDCHSILYHWTVRVVLDTC